MRIDRYSLPSGVVLSVTADAVSSGSIRRIAAPGSSTQYAAESVSASSTVSVGPFLTPRNYEVVTDVGALTIAQTNSDGQASVTNLDASGVVTSDLNPKFQAQLNLDQSVNDSAYTKLIWGTENWDVGSCFASSAWTPNVAGYYLIQCSIATDNNSGVTELALYKNGSRFRTEKRTGCNYIQGGWLVYANGTTDYFEVYVWQNSGGAILFYKDNVSTLFEGVMIP